MGKGARRTKRVALWTGVGAGGLIVVVALFTLAANLLIVYGAKPFIVTDAAAAPLAPVVIVPGGSLESDGTPTPFALSRIETAVRLYREGKVSALDLSGYPEEVNFMAGYARANGIPESALLTDPAGSNTYDTMANALKVFGVRTALVSTQRYHLYRAVYLARSLGIEATGVPAAGQPDPGLSSDTVREVQARVKAFLEVHF